MAGPWEKYGTAPNLTSEKVDEEFANKVEQEKETYDTQVKDTTTSKINMFGDEYQIPSFFTSPAGAVLAGGAAALTALGAVQTVKGAAKAYTSIKDRLMNKPEIDRTVDVQMDKSLPKTFSPPTNVGPVTNLPGTPQELEKALGPDWEAKIAKSDAIRKERQAIAQQNARVAMGELTSPTPANPVPAPQPAAPSPVAQVAAQTAPVAPPTVVQIAQQAAPAVAEAAQAPAATIPPEPQKEGKKRGTSTKEERAAKQESYNKLAAEAPEGFRPQYTKKKGEMGPGAYNWLYGQEGEKAPQVWKALFGEKNIPYSHEPSSELQSRYADYKLSVPEPGMGLNEPPRVEGGAHKKPKYIPKNIKGAISPGAALGSGAIAAALGLSASPEAQAAMQRASSAVQDLGVSPDIFAGKGEELGRLGSTYVTAGNPSYRAELLTEMKKTKDPERYQLLLREYEKAKGNVPGGRGIAPPSAYMR